MNRLSTTKVGAAWRWLARLIRNILPVTIAVLSWIGLVSALLVLVSLLLAMLIPMSPLLAIGWAWEERAPVTRWWGKQFDRGMKIIFPNGKLSDSAPLTGAFDPNPLTKKP